MLSHRGGDLRLSSIHIQNICLPDRSLKNAHGSISVRIEKWPEMCLQRLKAIKCVNYLYVTVVFFFF